MSGFDGDIDNCVLLPEFFDGRLGVAYDTAVREGSDLSGIINQTVRDSPTSANFNPLPLSPNSTTLSPCIGDDVIMIINPQVDESVHIDWTVNSAPGQYLGSGTGALWDFPEHEYWRKLSNIQEVNPNGSEPPITVRIETHFGPGHPDCGRRSYDLVIQPTECL